MYRFKINNNDRVIIEQINDGFICQSTLHYGYMHNNVVLCQDNKLRCNECRHSLCQSSSHKSDTDSNIAIDFDGKIRCSYCRAIYIELLLKNQYLKKIIILFVYIIIRTNRCQVIIKKYYFSAIQNIC